MAHCASNAVRALCRIQAAVRLLLWASIARLLVCVRDLAVPEGAIAATAGQLQGLTPQVDISLCVSLEVDCRSNMASVCSQLHP